MPTKKSTRKKITAAARSMAGKVVKAVKAAPGRINKAARKSLASAKTAVAKKMSRPAAKKPVAKLEFKNRKGSAPAPGAVFRAPAENPDAPKTSKGSRLSHARKMLAARARPATPEAGVLPVAKPAAAPRRGKLPEAYGTKQLFLVARDPRWLFAQWDFTGAEQHALNKLSADGHLTLHIFKDAPHGEMVAQAKIPAEARHWFVPVGHGETRYIAELGYTSKHGGWVSIATSKPVVTPPDTIAPDMAAMMATIPPDVPFQEVMQKFGALLAKNLPLIAAIERVRATGWDKMPEVTVSTAAQHWTPKQARELARIAGAQTIRNRIATELAALSSADILRLIPSAAALLETPPPAPPKMSPEALAAESAPTSPSAGWSGHLS